MSFRRQLLLSLAVLVIVPAVVAALAIGRVVRANENAKADARLDAAARVTTIVLGQLERRANRRATTLQGDAALRQALDSGQLPRIRRALAQALTTHQLTGARARLEDGRTVTTGARDAVGVARVRAQRRGGGTVELSLGVLTSTALVKEIETTTGVATLIVDAKDRTLAKSATFPSSAVVDPTRTPPTVAGRWRTENVAVASLDATRYTAVLAVQPTAAGSGLGLQLVLTVLLGLLAIGIAFGWLLMRNLRDRIGDFMDAAARLGRGDFSATSAIPVKGNDEFATLGRAFIGMSRQLDQRVDQLENERNRVQNSIMRLGKSFAANLDRDSLVELVVESAVDGLTADAGRAMMPTGPGGAHEARGAFGTVLEAWDVLADAERRALSSGSSAEVGFDGLHAIAEPIDLERGKGPLGVISVARRRPFTPEERNLLRYLTEQAAVSLRNVGRHEEAARDSITDELTGLFNRRRFDDVLSQAASRATPEDPIALVMIDLDRFKIINDTHGHPFGDTVLKAVAEVVRETIRDRDLPARYGGEELAVVLAKGDTEGARDFAERLREQIEALQLGDERTGPVAVTASFGVASLPSDGDGVGALVRAADEALYRAKRAGRNRVEMATPTHGPQGEVL